MDDSERDVASRAWRKYAQAAEALDQADEAEDFQAVGMRLREALIAFVQEVGTPAMVPAGETPLQRANVKGWLRLITQAIAPGSHNEQLRSYLRKMAEETWDLVNWLTDTSNASRFDGVIALDATAYLLSAYSVATIRHERGVPDRCPACASYQLTVDFRGFEDEDFDKPLEFNLCEVCGWEQLTQRAGSSGASPPTEGSTELPHA